MPNKIDYIDIQPEITTVIEFLHELRREQKLTLLEQQEVNQSIILLKQVRRLIQELSDYVD